VLWIVVFDTNILISALLSTKGNPFRCLALAKTGRVQSVTCQEILAEFRETLILKFKRPRDEADSAAEQVRGFSRIVAITRSLRAVPDDPDDDIIVECAVVSSATHIVTGDKRHLLPLGRYQDIAIVRPADFLALVTSRQTDR
jgi:putative PIN family toxin of toxin-antitoxin system